MPRQPGRQYGNMLAQMAASKQAPRRKKNIKGLEKIDFASARSPMGPGAQKDKPKTFDMGMMQKKLGGESNSKFAPSGPLRERMPEGPQKPPGKEYIANPQARMGIFKQNHPKFAEKSATEKKEFLKNHPLTSARHSEVKAAGAARKAGMGSEVPNFNDFGKLRKGAKKNGSNPARKKAMLALLAKLKK